MGFQTRKESSIQFSLGNSAATIAFKETVMYEETYNLYTHEGFSCLINDIIEYMVGNNTTEDNKKKIIEALMVMQWTLISSDLKQANMN